MLNCALCVAITSLVFILVVFHHLKRKGTTRIPGPAKSHPNNGNLEDLALAGSLHQFLKNLHEQYGSITHFWWGKQMVVSIASPVLFKQQAKLFDRPQLPFELFMPFLTKHSLQYANGNDGRKRHSAYSSSFGYGEVKRHFDIFQKTTDEILNEWAKKPDDEHLDLAEYMFRYATKNILLFSFGKYFDDNKKIDSLKTSYDIVMDDMGRQLLGEKLEHGSLRKEIFDKETANFKSLLEYAFEHAKENPPGPGEPEKFIDVLVKMDQSYDVTIADMLLILVGGMHTTGFLLTWALYFMAQNKDIQSKLYNEVNAILENERVTGESQGHLTYVRQVIDETLRCSVLAPYAARVEHVDYELGGHHVPAGTPVIQALGVVLGDRNMWPNPTKFDPERFSDENRAKLPGFGFEPFGFAGKRKCPGYRFAYAEATVFIADVIREFEISLVGAQQAEMVHGLVTSPKDPIWITVKKRQEIRSPREC